MKFSNHSVVQDANVLGKGNVAPQIMGELHSKGEVRNCEIYFYSKSGQKKTGMLSCSIIHDNSGHEVGVAFVVHDVSEQKAMEQKLLKA